MLLDRDLLSARADRNETHCPVLNAKSILTFVLWLLQLRNNILKKQDSIEEVIKILNLHW